MVVLYARISKALLAASMVLFVICLANDGFYIDGADSRAWSAAWGLLLLGWLAVGTGILAWLANPVLFLGWAFFHFKRFKSAAVYAAIAPLLMISFLLSDQAISSEKRKLFDSHRLWAWLLAVGGKLDGVPGWKRPGCAARADSHMKRRSFSIRSDFSSRLSSLTATDHN